MSKTWYPVIDGAYCKECGACVEKCPQGVYAKDKKHPVVKHPERCIQGCRVCANLCPKGIIDYVGDDCLAALVGCECACEKA